MNVPLLYSVYSQVFEGITDRITEEKIIQAITSNTEGIPLSPSKNETSSSDMSRRVESGILHDHMYTRLEKELADSLTNASDLTTEDLSTVLMSHPIIKVSGQAEIEDYERIRTYFKKFNELVEVIAYSTKSSDVEHKGKVLDLIVKISQASNNEQRKKHQQELDKLTNAVSKAKEMNLLQDQVLLDNLAMFPEVFNPDGYDVVITPKNNEAIQYRGVLDRSWLRVSPQLINNMYGGQSAAPWTMVGIITHIQGTYIKPKSVEIAQDSENPMMLDAFRNLFRGIRTFDRMFLESKVNTEIILSPLAIYREVPVSHSGSS